jgi:hypothetical protein
MWKSVFWGSVQKFNLYQFQWKKIHKTFFKSTEFKRPLLNVEWSQNVKVFIVKTFGYANETKQLLKPNFVLIWPFLIHCYGNYDIKRRSKLSYDEE